MTPQHLSVNQLALLKKIDDAEIPEDLKMFYREASSNAISSTNGRTTDEKIQDLTEQCAAIMQMSISRQLENLVTEKKIDGMSRDITDLKTEVEKQGNEITTLSNEENVIKSKMDKPMTKIEALVKSRWAVVVLGSVVCISCVFAPQIVELAKFVFSKVF